jgi:hypothetical protein
MLARLVIGLAFLGVACGGSDYETADTGAEAVSAAPDTVDTTGHDTKETAIEVPEIDDAFTVTERRDIPFSLPAGKTAFFRVHYRDTWAMNGVLNPPNFGLRIDAKETDPYLKVAVSFECDGEQNGGRAECGFGLANGSWECDWFPDPLAKGDAWDHNPLITMSKMSCNTITNSSGWFTIRVERDAGASTNGLAKLRVRNALDSLNDPRVDQDAPR